MNYPIFNIIKATSPDFFIFNGDEIYGDNACPASGPSNVTGWDNIPGDFPRSNDPSVNWSDETQVHDVYFRHWKYNRADPNLQSLLRNVSMYSQADDHEVANNYAPSSYYSNITKDRIGFPNLVKVGIQEFFNFSPIERNSSDPNRIYRSFHWGKDADLFIVDQHSYRSRNDMLDTPANNKTLLGKAQLHWLEQGLLTSNATWKIVSLDDPIPIPSCVHKESVTEPLGCDNFATDGKTNNMTFTRERNEFLAFLDEHNVKNVIFVVTDVHFAANVIVNQDFNGDGKNFTYYELVSGPLSAGPSQPSPLDPTINATYLYKEGPLFNFGYYKIEHEKKDGKAHLISEVIDINGLVRPGSGLDLTPR
jgi:alkaline phosphatase D